MIDVDIEKITQKAIDTIYDEVYDEIDTYMFSDEDYDAVEPIVKTCILEVGKELVKRYSERG
jgi:hypothetical protein